MRTKEVKLYQFDELIADTAQERARNWYRQYVLCDGRLSNSDEEVDDAIRASECEFDHHGNYQQVDEYRYRIMIKPDTCLDLNREFENDEEKCQAQGILDQYGAWGYIVQCWRRRPI